MPHTYTLIYPADPGEKSNAGDIHVKFRRDSLEDAERYAEKILKERGVWTSRHAQLRAGSADTSHIASVHTIWAGAGGWRRPPEGLLKKVLHHYTAEAYVDGQPQSRAFVAERAAEAKRIALEIFSFETTIWLRTKGFFIAKYIPGKGWVKTI